VTEITLCRIVRWLTIDLVQHREFLGRRLSATAKTVRAYAEQQMAEAGSSLTVAIVTRVLTATPDLTQRELADRLGIEAPTMARHVDRLERDGIVTRTRDDEDRRRQRVRLTARGESLRDRLFEVSERTHHQLTAALSGDELTTFELTLDRLGAHARALLDGPASDGERRSA
jgi:MarR family transcriptional regulator for hemolysin